MLQDDNVVLFHSVLKEFQVHGVLNNFILIGSWALRVYQEYFGNDPGIGDCSPPGLIYY